MKFDTILDNMGINNHAKNILRKLIEGNNRFVNGCPIGPNRSQERRENLSDGQEPYVILVTCSDSRINPVVLFDAGIGDIFSVRNAGGVVLGINESENHSLASIEFYAKELCGNKHGVLLVLGHTNCAAVQSCLNLPLTKSMGSKSMDKLRDTILANIKTTNDCNDTLSAIKANAAAILSSIIEKSDVIKKVIASGNLTPFQATYDIVSGKVEYMDKFETLSLE